jgi:hypothetical protein
MCRFFFHYFSIINRIFHKDSIVRTNLKEIKKNSKISSPFPTLEQIKNKSHLEMKKAVDTLSRSKFRRIII